MTSYGLTCIVCTVRRAGEVGIGLTMLTGIESGFSITSPCFLLSEIIVCMEKLWK